MTKFDQKSRLPGQPLTVGISAQLWDLNLLDAFRALHEPFVVALGLGTLCRDSFRHYVAQDAHYLHFFARAFEATIAKCGSDPQQQEARTTLERMLQGVYTELEQLHGSFARSLDMAAPGVLDQAHPSTDKYTSFLIEVAEDPQASVAEVLASMLPCARLYAFVGCCLAVAHPEAANGDSRHPYASWIRNYSGEDYMCTVVEMEELMDRLGPGVPFDRLVLLYRRAMQLEVEFFAAQPGAPPKRQVTLLACSFEGACVNGSLPDGTSSAAAVKDALRDGCCFTLEAALSAGLPTRVVCSGPGWRGDLMAEGLGLPPAAGGVEEDGSGAVGAAHLAVIVHLTDSCSVKAQSEALSARTESQRPQTRHKQTLLEWLSEHAGDRQQPGGRCIENGSAIVPGADCACGLSVYVGGGAGDIAPLLLADFGVVLGQADLLLLRALASQGVQLRPLCAAPLEHVPRSCSFASHPVVYEAASWLEVSAFLFG